VVLPLFIPREQEPEGRSAAEFERYYARLYDALAAHPPYSLPGCGVEQAGASRRSVWTWLSLEGAGDLGLSPATLAHWAARGLRLVGLVHAEANALGTSSGESSPGPGLTSEGEVFAREAFRLGLAVDVSHASDELTDAVLTLAEEGGGRVVASHSNARALARHPRNLTDAQLRRLGALGGVVGVNFHQPYLRRGGVATLQDVVDQVLYIRRLAGVGAVALGSDYEGGIRPAQGLASAADYPALARALRRAGLSRAEVNAVFSGNALRVLCGVEKSPDGW